MSITIWGTILVPSSVTEEQAKQLEQEIAKNDKFQAFSVERDVKRTIHEIFSAPKVIKSIGLEMPNVQVSAWCDMGADPFPYRTAFTQQIKSVLKKHGFEAVWRV